MEELTKVRAVVSVADLVVHSSARVCIKENTINSETNQGCTRDAAGALAYMVSRQSLTSSRLGVPRIGGPERESVHSAESSAFTLCRSTAQKKGDTVRNVPPKWTEALPRWLRPAQSRTFADATMLAIARVAAA